MATQQQRQPDLTVIDVAFAASLASAFGSSFILLNWLCNPQARRLFFLRLIVFLAIANLLSSISYMMSFVQWRLLRHEDADDSSSRAWCLAQALLMVIFENASILWTISIALALHQQVVRRAAAERHERYYHLVAWGLPVVLAVSLMLGGRLGPADEPRESWCWIASNSGPAVNRTSTLLAAAGGGEEAPTAANGDGPHVVAGAVPFVSDGGGSSTRYLQLLLFYFPLLLAFVFNLTVYLRVGAAFARMARDGAVEASKERMIQLRLRLYLLVFSVVWAIPIVHRTLQLIGCAGCDPEWLRLLHTATQCSLGWLNTLVYGCNEATLRPYRDALSHFSCNLLAGLQLSGGRRGAARQYSLSAAATAPMLGSETDSSAAATHADVVARLPSSMLLDGSTSSSTTADVAAGRLQSGSSSGGHGGGLTPMMG